MKSVTISSVHGNAPRHNKPSSGAERSLLDAERSIRGKALDRGIIPQWAVDRFHQNYTKDADGCWNWKSALNSKGYGCVSIDGVKYSTHRIAFVLWFGRIAADTLVAHTCDNPRCVNPGHLFPTDHSGNMQDMVMKKRHHMQKKTHCVRGHPLSGENIRLRAGGERRCLACQKLYHAKRNGAQEQPA